MIGTAPDIFEGVMMPELYLADALGAAGKPIMRVHTAGSVGGSTAVVATHLIESQIHERVLTLAFEKQSEGDTNFAFSSGRSGGVARAVTSRRTSARTSSVRARPTTSARWWR